MHQSLAGLSSQGIQGRDKMSSSMPKELGQFASVSNTYSVHIQDIATSSPLRVYMIFRGSEAPR